MIDNIKNIQVHFMGIVLYHIYQVKLTGNMLYPILYILSFPCFSKKYSVTLCFSLKKGRSVMASFLVCHLWYGNDLNRLTPSQYGYS